MAERRGRSADLSRGDARRSLERDIERLDRRRGAAGSFWRSLGVLGTVGWSIALPAALGAWLGHHIDLRYETGVRFTLMLLTLGVTIGSLIAWRVLREHER